MRDELADSISVRKYIHMPGAVGAGKLINMRWSNDAKKWRPAIPSVSLEGALFNTALPKKAEPERRSTHARPADRSPPCARQNVLHP